MKNNSHTIIKYFSLIYIKCYTQQFFCRYKLKYDLLKKLYQYIFFFEF